MLPKLENIRTQQFRAESQESTYDRFPGQIDTMGNNSEDRGDTPKKALKDLQYVDPVFGVEVKRREKGRDANESTQLSQYQRKKIIAGIFNQQSTLRKRIDREKQSTDIPSNPSIFSSAAKDANISYCNIEIKPKKRKCKRNSNALTLNTYSKSNSLFRNELSIV